jgi:hypothetical protein
LPIDEMAAPGAPLDGSVRLGLVVATLIASVVGWALARSRYAKSDWRDSENARPGQRTFATDGAGLVGKLALPFVLVAELSGKLDGIFEQTALGMPPDDSDEEEAT